MSILEELNERQREAAEHINGPLLILAGAGSGKTKTIITRIANILEQGYAWPSQILAITFTNKAAREMRERIAAMDIPETEKIWMSTFHSACAKILRMHGDRLGYSKHFKIIDTDDQRTLIKKYLKQYNLDPKQHPPAKVAGIISKCKNDGTTPEELHDVGRTDSDRKIAMIYKDYEKDLKRYDSMDFDDLILKTIELFHKNEDILRYFQKKFKFILVDEYQDTNATQYELVQLLAKSHGNLCVVGDDDQSIYGWRGADINNILDFENDWPNAKVVKLEENYRSTPVILECANSVIKNNHSRKPKALFTNNTEDQNKVVVAKLDEGRDEAQFVVNKIREIREDSPFDYNDFVVLYRTNAQSRNFEDAMRRAGIPYKTVGSISFYARAEIKDILSYVSLLDNPNDDIAFLRIVNQPKRSIGAKSVEKLNEFAEFKGWSLYETASRINEVPNMTPAIKVKFKRFVDLIESIREQIDGLPLDEVIRTVYKLSGYEDMLMAEKLENSESRRQNIEELVTAAKQFTMTSEDQSVTAFLENAALSSSTEEFDSEGQVSLMTLHSAKGLEFPVVFMVGMEDNLFPSYMSLQKNDIEEERRLCYVGITRAQNRLFMTYADTRMLYGNFQHNDPSIFLGELPKDQVEVIGDDSWDEPFEDDMFEIEGIDDSLLGSNAKKRQIRQQKKKEKSRAIFMEMGRHKGSDASGFSEGDKVKHKSFGIGTIVQINKTVLTIAFPGLGIKKIDADWVEAVE